MPARQNVDAKEERISSCDVAEIQLEAVGLTCAIYSDSYLFEMLAGPLARLASSRRRRRRSLQSSWTDADGLTLRIASQTRDAPADAAQRACESSFEATPARLSAA